jgi:DNA-directed RNA polymerase specialized sigma subunit
MPKLNEYTEQKNKPLDEYAQWKNKPTKENYNNLLRKLTPIIETALNSFGSPSLKIRAYIIAANSLNSYDPSKGTALPTHIYNNLKGLHRYKAERSSAIHIPEQVRLDRHKIYEFEKDYLDIHGVVPSDQTIADVFKISPKRVQKAKQVAESPELFDDKGVQITTGTGKTPEQVWMDYVYHDLDDTNKKVLEWTTGYGGKEMLPKHVIAKKLGVSAPAVSSRISTITKKLEEGFNDGTRSLQ